MNSLATGAYSTANSVARIAPLTAANYLNPQIIVENLTMPFETTRAELNEDNCGRCESRKSSNSNAPANINIKNSSRLKRNPSAHSFHETSLRKLIKNENSSAIRNKRINDSHEYVKQPVFPTIGLSAQPSEVSFNGGMTMLNYNKVQAPAIINSNETGTYALSHADLPETEEY